MNERKRHNVRTAITIVVLSLLTSTANHFAGLAGLETVALDAWLRMGADAEISNVVIVTITDDDYENHFGGQSPLAPEVLSRVLQGIARGRPALIGVDLDTQPERIALGSEARVAVPPVVWAVAPEIQDDEAALDSLEDPRLSRFPSGVAWFPQDGDGVVRRYERTFSNGRTRRPSFPWAIVRAVCETEALPREHGEICRSQAVASDDEGGLLLSFARDRFDFPQVTIDQVLKASSGPGWAEAGPLRGKIVLLGGLYRAARDEHATPKGHMAGVQLVAQAIESELRGRGVRPANELIMLGMELLGGLLVAMIFRYFPIRSAVRLTLGVIPLLAIGGSLAAFYSFARWANFVPVLVGVLIHELYETAERAAELETELQRERAQHASSPRADAPELRPEAVTWTELGVADGAAQGSLQQ